MGNRKWESADTAQIAADRRFWTFAPKAKWHGFKGYGENQHFLDPMKLMLITPGIDIETGVYQDFASPLPWQPNSSGKIKSFRKKAT